MRYPTMTRVFAVFLALASLMLLATAGFGIYKTLERRDEMELELQTLSDKALEYRDLNRQLSGQKDYLDEKQELKDKEEQYEEENSDHRRELTEYSAKKGGIQMGTDALDEAQLAFNASKAEFEAGLAEFNAKEAEFNAACQQLQEGKAALAAGREVYNASVNSLSAAKEALNALDSLDAVLDTNAPDARQKLIESCDNSLAYLDNAMASIENLKAQGIITPEQAEQVENEIIKATGMSSAELRAKIVASRDAVAAGDPNAGMTEAERQEYEDNKIKIHSYAAAARIGIAQAEPKLQQQKAELDAAEQKINETEPMLEAGRKGIEEGRAMMDKGAAAIAEAEQKLYQSRTYIWYEMGQLEEQLLELQMQKAELEGDNQELEKLRQEFEVRKELEAKRTSLSLDLRDVKEIKELYEADTELYEASQIYIEKHSKEVDSLIKLEFLSEGLMILTGIMGFMPLISAFKNNKQRKKRLLLPVISFALALGTLVYGFGAGFGLFKSVLVVLLSALAVILSAVPNKKKQEILIEE